MRKTTSFFLCVVLLMSLLTGCADTAEDPGTSSNYEENTNSATEPDNATSDADVSPSGADMFSDRDSEAAYDESSAVKIELNGTSATASSNSVNISGSTVTITEEATYIISGTLDDGMVIVDAPDTAKLQLVLDGVDITSETCAPLYILEADKVFVTLVGNNTLTNGGSFEAIDDNNIDGTVFSKQDLTFNGSGSLTVSSPTGHGIVCKDDLVVTDGTYIVTSAAHAVDANDSVRVKNANITAYAGKDGIHVENTDDASKGFVYIESGSFEIEAEGDGIATSAYMQIEDGTFHILAGGGYENGTSERSDNWGGFGGGRGGGKHGGGGMPGGMGSQTSTDTSDDSSTSMKGLKAETTLLISGGIFDINSADDAVHSNGSTTIEGGVYEIASGDDALHAEETLTVSDGTINITTSYEGLEALHVAVSGGNIRLVSSDDGLNAAGGTDASGTGGGRDGMFGGGGFGGGNSNGSVIISGGTLYINASGDGIDANGTLEITGGHTTVVGPTQGDTAVLDYDKTATISGATFIGTGSSMMAQSISGSDQGVIAVSVGSQSAGTKITITNENGTEILSYTPELSYQIMIFSSPDIVSGETYTVTVGSQSGEFEAN